MYNIIKIFKLRYVFVQMTVEYKNIICEYLSFMNDLVHKQVNYYICKNRVNDDIQ